MSETKTTTRVRINCPSEHDHGRIGYVIDSWDATCRVLLVKTAQEYAAELEQRDDLTRRTAGTHESPGLDFCDGVKIWVLRDEVEVVS